MKAVHLVFVGVFISVATVSIAGAADPVPPAPPGQTEPAPPPKDSKKPDAAKSDPAPEAAPPAAAAPKPPKEVKEPKEPKETKEGKDSKEGKEPKDSKADTPSKPKAESKGDTKSESKEPKADAGKKDGASHDKAARVEPTEPPVPAPPPVKPDAPAPKRSLGSVILTVKLALMSDPLLFPYDIEVEMDGDKAVLTGKVATEDDKRSAAEIAQSVDTVKGVVNKLEVAKELGPQLVKRQDHAICQYVKERFARSETLKSSGFDLKCEEGVIFLSGKTRFQVIALEAAQAARQVPGVRAVDTTNIQLSGESKE